MLRSVDYQGAAKRLNLKVFIAIDCSAVSFNLRRSQAVFKKTFTFRVLVQVAAL
jgi:hypothetical protein